MWRTWFKPFGKRVVMTVDFGGETRVRFVKRTASGDMVRGIVGWVMLQPDGTISHIYIRRWYEI